MSFRGLRPYSVDRKLLLCTITLILPSILLLFFSIIRATGLYFIYIPYSMSIIQQIISIILGCVVIIYSVYNNYHENYNIFGYFLCLIGGLSVFCFQIYLIIQYHFFFYYLSFKHFLFSSLIIYGLVLDRRGNINGSRICLVLGIIDLIIQFYPFLYFGFFSIPYYQGGGFLTIVYWIQLEPFLTTIGGYFLYYMQCADF
jgi:hypothetical protein